MALPETGSMITAESHHSGVGILALETGITISGVLFRCRKSHVLHLLFGSKRGATNQVTLGTVETASHLYWSRREQFPTVQAPCVQQVQEERLRPSCEWNPLF